MRKHTKRVKYYRKKGSKKLRGGNPFARLLGFGRPAVNPNDAQAQQVAQAQADEVAGHQQMIESKQQQASALRNQCQDYQRRADQLDEEAADHMRATAEIARNREAKNRCDQEHAMRLQAIEQDYQQRLSAITQQHNQELAAENQRAQEEHAACLREGMRLVPTTEAMAQNPEARAATLDPAARQVQAGVRGLQARRAAQQKRASQSSVDPLGGLPVSSGGGRKSRRGGRKSRRGGRKSRRGGARCSLKLKKNCPYYKKYGYHKM